MTEDHTHAEYIFHLVRQYSNSEKRAECLDNECGGDTQLRTEVERMLSAERTTVEPTAAIDSESKPPVDPSAVPGEPPNLESGTTIGNYELKKLLKTGGMGKIYFAKQIKRMKREVALKFPSHLITDDNDRRTFEREYQSLALLKHSNIATVYDSGVTEAGQPYFAMELIHGLTITEYCDEHRLCVAARLSLFLDVCRAIDHAHAANIVHRDIKPANILVQDERGPTVKVIDFGIAKTLEDRSTKRGTPSASQYFVGTPEYVSPEQARPTAIPIDGRADVYSLGVLLYELLVGCTPLAHALSAVSDVEEMKHVICETTPRVPSAQVTCINRVVDTRSTSVQPLRRELRRDLDWITMKAIRKNREDRYQSVHDLASDVADYLAGDPVRSRVGYAYSLRNKCVRWVARHAFLAPLFIVAITALLVVRYPIAKFVFDDPDINRTYESELASAFPSANSGRAFQHTQVIAIDTSTNFKALAARYHVEGVSQNGLKSWRRMHGRLMQKLAKTGCRAVVFCINFFPESEFDDSFNEGVAALAAAGIDVVVLVPYWWLNEPGIPALSPRIIDHVGVRYGSPILRLKKPPYVAQLVARRGINDPQPSLALATYAAYRRPGMDYDIVIDADEEKVELSYWKRNRAASREKVRLSPPDEIALTRYTMGTVDRSAFRDAFDSAWGLRKSDLLGFVHFDIPTSANLRASTISYQSAFGATVSQLAEKTRGKVVIIADAIPGHDSQELLGGRSACGAYAQAAVLEQLIDGNIPRMIHPWLEQALWCACAVIGWLLAFCLSSYHPMIRTVIIIVTVAVGTALCIVFYRWQACLINPVPVSCSILIAYFLCSWALRERLAHQSFWLSRPGALWSNRTPASPRPTSDTRRNDGTRDPRQDRPHGRMAPTP